MVMVACVQLQLLVDPDYERCVPACTQPMSPCLLIRNQAMRLSVTGGDVRHHAATDDGAKYQCSWGLCQCCTQPQEVVIIEPSSMMRTFHCCRYLCPHAKLCSELCTYLLGCLKTSASEESRSPLGRRPMSRMPALGAALCSSDTTASTLRATVATIASSSCACITRNMSMVASARCYAPWSFKIRRP